MSASFAAPRAVSITGLSWLAAALVVGATGQLAALPAPAPQLTLLVLALATIVAGTRLPAFRAWIDALDLRILVGIHAMRVVGFYFFYLAAAGQLSPPFARNAGWGDIATAAGALALLATGLPRSRAHRAAYLAWNAFGLLDFAVVVATAAWIGSRQPADLAPLLRLPLALLPTFVVPLLIASHVFLFRRLLAARSEAVPAS